MKEYDSLDTSCTSLPQAFPSKHMKEKKGLKACSLKSAEPIVRDHSKGICGIFLGRSIPLPALLQLLYLEHNKPKPIIPF